MISTDQLHPAALSITQHTNVIRAAKAAGVGHFVYTSMPNPVAANEIPFAPHHVATERELLNSGVAFTSLRVA